MSMSKVATLGMLAALASDPQYVAAAQERQGLEKLSGKIRVGGKMVSPRAHRAAKREAAPAKREANMYEKAERNAAPGLLTIDSDARVADMRNAKLDRKLKKELGDRAGTTFDRQRFQLLHSNEPRQIPDSAGTMSPTQAARAIAKRHPVATTLGLGTAATLPFGLSALLGGGGAPAASASIPLATAGIGGGAGAGAGVGAGAGADAAGSSYLPYLLAALGIGTAGIGAGMYYGSGNDDEEDK